MSDTTTAELRAAVQQFIRAMGLLQVRQTPCGQPLPVAQAHTLMFLAHRGADAAPPTQRVIADHLGLDKSTVTRLLQKMHARGFIHVEACATDQRAKCISLTEQGRNTGAQVDRASCALFGQVMGSLAPDAHGGIVDAIQQLTQAVQQSRGGEPS